MVDFHGDDIVDNVHLDNFQTDFPLAWEVVKIQHFNSKKGIIFMRAELLAKILQRKYAAFGFFTERFLENAKYEVDSQYGKASKAEWNRAINCLICGWRYGEELGKLVGRDYLRISEFRDPTIIMEGNLRDTINQLQIFGRGQKQL